MSSPRLVGRADLFRPARLRALAAGLAVFALALLGCPGTSEIDSAGLQSNQGIDWRDEVIYQLLTDRFANGDPNNDFNVRANDMQGYHGGDWQGVIDRIPYLKALGVTAIWISPVVRNVEEDAGNYSYHGYWTQSFEHVNPHFGDLAKLREMVQECHANGIKVICDIVCNHVGQLFFYDINRNGVADIDIRGTGGPGDPIVRYTEYDPNYEEPEVSDLYGGTAPVIFFDDPANTRIAPQPDVFANPDWFHRRGRILDYGVQAQTETGDFPGGLKDLATERADVRDALVDVFVKWLETVDFDGYRIDTIKHVETGFWSEFCARIRDAALARGKYNFFQFGEAFDGNDALLGSYTQADMLDSVFYFSQKYTVMDGVIGNNNPTSNIENLVVTQRAANYRQVPQPDGVGIAPADCLVNFIDNHDVNRYRNQFSSASLDLALGYLFTTPGVPCLYYGTEQDFAGGADPTNREDLWSSGYATDGARFQRIRQLIDIRNELAPLRRGTYAVRWSTTRTGSESDAGIYAFERQFNGETVLVIMNCNPNQTSSTTFGGGQMTVSFPDSTVLEDRLDSGFSYTVTNNTQVTISVPARSIRILVAQ